MWIERLLRDQGGTKVKFPDVTYYFKPEQEGGPHIALVEPPEHIERFLSISHGYREHVRPEDAYVLPVAPVAPVEPSIIVPPVPVTIPQGDLAAAIAQASEATASIADATNAVAFTMPAPDAPQPIEGEGEQGDLIPASFLPTEDELKAMSLEELQAVYAAEHGHKAHWNAGSEKLISSILAARAA